MKNTSFINRGFLVIKRIDYFADPNYESKKRTSSVNLDDDKILKSYKGIEGEPWPLENFFSENHLSNGLAPINKYKDVINYNNGLPEHFLTDLLYLAIGHNPNELEDVPQNFSFLGYEYGIYESEYNCYSVIFNEIIYGKYEPLRSFGNKLNNNLLISSPSLIVEINEIRSKLLKEGADLESFENHEELVPISIYGDQQGT